MLTGVRRDTLVMQEETFGPMLPTVRAADLYEAVRMANDLYEAVRMANDCEYGLAASA